MIEIDIPGWKKLELQHLVCDYNGTLACDGQLLPELTDLITDIAAILEVHIITAGTFGLVREQLAELPVQLKILPQDDQANRKADFIKQLGSANCVCLGNGRNDKTMLEQAALGLCLIQKEGAAAETLQAADVICTSAVDALQLLMHPRRLIATLRN